MRRRSSAGTYKPIIVNRMKKSYCALPMLTVYRRHGKHCIKLRRGRNYRWCGCTFWVDGLFNGQEVRKSLRTWDWQEAQNLVRQWGVEGRKNVESKKVTVEEAWDLFLSDAQARGLRNSTLRKYLSLKKQMTEFAGERRLSLLSDFSLVVLGQFRTTWTDGPRSSAKKLERLR